MQQRPSFWEWSEATRRMPNDTLILTHYEFEDDALKRTFTLKFFAPIGAVMVMRMIAQHGAHQFLVENTRLLKSDIGDLILVDGDPWENKDYQYGDVISDTDSFTEVLEKYLIYVLRGRKYE